MLKVATLREKQGQSQNIRSMLLQKYFNKREREYC